MEKYKLNRRGGNFISALSQKAESWMHRQVAQTRRAGGVLEIGAGSLNHLPYETSSDYDIVEPFRALYAGSPHRSRVRHEWKDMSEVPLTARYERIISIAVLEHLEDLPQVVAKSGLLLEEDGLFQHGIPSEGGFLWELGWRMTTGLSYRIRTGLSYVPLIRHEHVNKATEILEIVRHFFRSVRVRRFPFPGGHFSLYAYIRAAFPDTERCAAFLQTR